MYLVVARDSVAPAWKEELLHESASGVSLRKANWFTTNHIPIDTCEVPEVRWRTNDEPLEQGLRKYENVGLLMLSVFILAGRICPRMKWRVVSIAIVPHDHAASGKSF